MKYRKLADAAARYGMTARAFELLLVEIGWMVDGRVCEDPVAKSYLTPEGEITDRGDGLLTGLLYWRRH